MKYAPFVLIIALAGQRMVQSIRIHTLELRVDGLRQNVEGLVGLAKTHTETISSLTDSLRKAVRADEQLLEIVNQHTRMFGQTTDTLNRHTDMILRGREGLEKGESR